MSSKKLGKKYILLKIISKFGMPHSSLKEAQAFPHPLEMEHVLCAETIHQKDRVMSGRETVSPSFDLMLPNKRSALQL